MNQVKKNKEETFIKFGSILGSSKSSSILENGSSQNQEVRSQVMTLSRQVDRLMSQTSRILNKPQEKAAFPWTILLVATLVSIATSGLVFFKVRSSQNLLKDKLTSFIDSKSQGLHEQIQSQTLDIQNRINQIEDHHRKHKDFSHRK